MSPLKAEAKTILELISIATIGGGKRISIRLDALIVVNSLCNPRDTPREIQHLIHDCLDLSKLFDYWDCVWLSRVDNVITYVLSQAGMSLDFTDENDRGK